MTINLNRAGVICTWSFWWKALLLAAFMFFATADDANVSQGIVFASIFWLLCVFSIIRAEPESVTLGWNSIKYRDRVQISKHRREDVLFTLSGVNSVTICQNPIERLFGFAVTFSYGSDRGGVYDIFFIFVQTE